MRLEKKNTEGSTSTKSELKEAFSRADEKSIEKDHANSLYITKCLHMIHYLIRKNIAITTNYGDMIEFVAKQL